MQAEDSSAVEVEEEIPGVTAPPTRRQVKGFKKWMKLASQEHSKAKQSDNDAARAAAAAVAHMFERRKFGN